MIPHAHQFSDHNRIPSNARQHVKLSDMSTVARDLALGINPIPDDCTWPMRLLYVEPKPLNRMWVHRWSPDNWYGTSHDRKLVQNPRYVAISYTWGRWRLKTAEKPEVRPLTILDGAWEVPRVRPECFETKSLKMMINSVCKYSEGMQTGRLAFCCRLQAHRSIANYVWLDIACIDQRDESQEGAFEVGRQVPIFSRAERVYCWLHSLPSLWFKSWERELYQRLRDAASNDDDQKLNALRQLRAGFERIFADPWFSSLWTLQESYISKDIALYTHTMCVFSGHEREGRQHFFISDLQNSLMELVRLCEADVSAAHPELFNSFRNMAEASGLAARAAEHPMAILAAAHRRTTQRENDRVYGIMQIFDLKLGKTKPGTPTGRGDPFTLPELEDELGAALLHHYPVLSQLHVHARDAGAGRGWRQGRWSRPVVIRSSGVEGSRYLHSALLCGVWPERVGDQLVGAFRGRACTIESLKTWWRNTEGRQMVASNTLIGICLDHVPSFDIECKQLHGGPEAEVEAELISLAGKLNPNSKILLLGTLNGRDGEGPSKKICLGLILGWTTEHPYGSTQFYKRIGVCYWEGSGTSDSSEWSQLEGHFG